MAATETAIDQAYKRFRVLSKLIEFEQIRARANPLDPRYLELGVIEKGDTKLEASRKITEAFDGLARLIEHVAILDMAGSFERLFRAKIGTSIGEIRSLIREKTERSASSPFCYEACAKC